MIGGDELKIITLIFLLVKLAENMHASNKDCQ